METVPSQFGFGVLFINLSPTHTILPPTSSSYTTPFADSTQLKSLDTTASSWVAFRKGVMATTRACEYFVPLY
jgi:hypothetical protein